MWYGFDVRSSKTCKTERSNLLMLRWLQIHTDTTPSLSNSDLTREHRLPATLSTILRSRSRSHDLLLHRMRDLDRLDLEMPIIAISKRSSRSLLLALLAVRFPLPTRLEELAHWEAWERVGFGVEDDVAEGE